MFIFASVAAFIQHEDERQELHLQLSCSSGKEKADFMGGKYERIMTLKEQC